MIDISLGFAERKTMANSVTLLDDVVVGTVSSGLQALSRGLLRSIIIRISRRRVMGKAILDEPEKYGKFIKKFSDDLLHSFGATGRLDIISDSALRTISSSRLILHLTSLAATDVSAEASLALMAQIYVDAGGNSGEDAAHFANSVMRAIRAAVEQSVLSYEETRHPEGPEASAQRYLEDSVRKYEAALGALINIPPQTSHRNAAQPPQSTSGSAQRL